MMLHFIYLAMFKDARTTHTIMHETVGYLTKYRRRIGRYTKHVSMLHLARMFLDDNNEMMSSACNILIYSILNKDEKDEDLQYLLGEYFVLFNIVLINLKQRSENNLSICEVVWLIVMCYVSIHSENEVPGIDQCISRITDAIVLNNCRTNPNLVAPLMKILTDGILKWKSKIKDFKPVLSNLMFIYFHYNTSVEYLDTLKEAPALQ